MTESLAQPPDRLRKAASTLALCLLALLAPALLAVGCGRGEPRAAAASAPPPPAIEYVSEWGTRGDAPGQLQDPVGPAVDAAGRVYLADRVAGSLAKFEASGVPLMLVDDPLIRNASAVDVDRGGAIYVANPEAGRIEIFWPEGEHMRSLRMPSQRGGMAAPFSFAVDALGTVFVPHPSAGEILSMDRHGRVESAWKMPLGASGQPSRPSLVVAAPGGGIFAGDARSGEIVKYAAGGSPAEPFGERAGGSAPLLSTAASAQYLFVLRDADPCLEVWTLDGRLAFRDNLGGRLGDTAAGRASQPASAALRPSLAVTPQGDLIVLDPAGPHVLRFRLHLNAPDPATAGR